MWGGRKGRGCCSGILTPLWCCKTNNIKFAIVEPCLTHILQSKHSHIFTFINPFNIPYLQNSCGFVPQHRQIFVSNFRLILNYHVFDAKYCISNQYYFLYFTRLYKPPEWWHHSSFPYYVLDVWRGPQANKQTWRDRRWLAGFAGPGLYSSLIGWEWRLVRWRESHLSLPARWTVLPGSWPRWDHHQEMSQGDLTEYGLRLRRLRISLIVRTARPRLSSTSSSTSSTSSSTSCYSSSSSSSSSRSRWDLMRLVRRSGRNYGDASGEFECYSSRPPLPPLPPRQSQSRPPALPPYPSSAVSLVNHIAKTILSWYLIVTLINKHSLVFYLVFKSASSTIITLLEKHCMPLRSTIWEYKTSRSWYESNWTVLRCYLLN